MQELRGTTIDRYRVEGLLGAGGMGSVWLVRHVESLQTYALKTLHTTTSDPQAVERFLREARAAAALRSKHVVKVVDAQTGYVDPRTQQPLPFLVMELLEGETLEGMLQRRGPLPPGEVLWVLRQVGRALEAAHAKGIVHRDLKPENVFVAIDEEGDPVTKVCDFGIAKLVGEAAAGLAESGALGTQTGLSLGTPLYMSPEQARNAAGVGPATDQWAFALIAYRALIGNHYFALAGSPADLLLKIVNDPLIAPSERAPSVFGPPFDAWFLRSLQRDPAARFASVAEQVEQLDSALGQPPAVAPEVVAAGLPPSLPASNVAPSAHAQLESAETVLQPSEGTIGAAVGVAKASRPPRRAGLVWMAALVLVGASVVAGGWLSRVKDPPASASSQGPASVGSASTATVAPPATTPVAASTPLAASSAPPLKPSAAPPAAPVAAPKGVKPVPSQAPTASASAAPPKAKLPAGATCARSNECESALCVAEVCK